MEGFQSNSQPISEEAWRLKQLLIKDDEQRRQQFITSLSERGKLSYSTEVPSANALEPLVNNQISVEQQLQQQVDYYQDALVTLKDRADDIAAENAKLYERMRKSIVNEPLFSSEEDYENEYISTSESEGEISTPQGNSPRNDKRPFPKKERLMKTKAEMEAKKAKEKDKLREKDIPFQVNGLNEEMNKLQDIQRAKSSHLESLLKSARKQIDEQERVISTLRTEVNYFKTPVKEIEDNKTLDQHPVHNTTSKSLPNAIPGTNLVARLTRECEDLALSLEKQQKNLAECNRRETQAYEQVKKSCELVEQAQLEKQEAMVKVRQLTTDMNQYKEKYFAQQKRYKEHQNVFNEKIKDEMQKKINSLDEKVGDQTFCITSLQNELEKTVRAKNDLKQEVEHVQLKLLQQDAQTTTLIDDTRNDTLRAIREKTLAEHELYRVQAEHKSHEKRRHQEIDQLYIELAECKRRLKIADDAILNYQNDAIKMTNQIAMAEQQAHREQLQRGLDQQSYNEEKKRIVEESNKREQELARLLKLNDERFSSTRNELTNMLESQSTILKKYKDECNTLNANFMDEKKKNEELMSRLSNEKAQFQKRLKDLTAQLSSDEQLKDVLEQQLRTAEGDKADLKEQVINLMNKQNIILRDRNLLLKEMELIKNRTKSPTTTIRQATLELP